MPDSLNLIGVKQLFDRLVSAYKELNQENPLIKELRKKMNLLETELKNTKAKDSSDKKRIRRMETKLELYKARLGKIGKT